MVKRTQTISQHLPTNYLSAFDHYVGLTFEGLAYFTTVFHFYTPENVRKTGGFWMFSGGIEMEY